MFINKLNDSTKLSDSVLSFGNFDGLHLGHQALINKVKEISKNKHIPSVLLSFNPHTNSIINNSEYKILMPINKKKSIIDKLDIDYFCEINFTSEFSKLSADNFLELLITKYNPSCIVFGYDNYFGYKKTGSYDYVANNSRYKNIDCILVKEYQKSKELIKTSIIKELILNNKIQMANKYLYTPYTLYGKVVKGYQIGRTLGFPTANIKANNEQIIPSNGVYSVNLIVGELVYKSICNIGLCPTLHNNKDISIEVHIMNQSLSLYESNVKIEFIKFIRPEKKFNNEIELKEQIKKDIASIKEERKIKSE